MNCIDCNKKLSKEKYMRCQPCRGKHDFIVMKVEFICKNCSNKFKVIPYYAKNRNVQFCSKSCKSKATISIEFLKKRAERCANQYGKNNKNWRGGITPLIEKIRRSLEYKQWRRAVFERDNYTCVMGGKSHGWDLQADHIRPFALYSELRFDINNGQTLCIDCHRKTDTYGKNARYMEARIL